MSGLNEALAAHEASGGWQVRQHESGLDVLVMKPGPGFDPTATEEAVQAALTKAAVVSPVVHVSLVESIPAGAAGKRPLIVSQNSSPAAS